MERFPGGSFRTLLLGAEAADAAGGSGGDAC